MAIQLKDFYFSLCFSNSRQQMEAQIGALILATDISRQNEYLSLFRAHLDKGDLRLEDARHRHLVLQVK